MAPAAPRDRRRGPARPRPPRRAPTGSRSSSPADGGSPGAQLEDEVGRLATGLGAAGIVAGHRVLMALGNRIEFVTTYLAVLRAQAVAVPVNPTSSSGELARMIADSGSRMVVADADTVTAVRAAVAAARGGPGRRPPGRLDRGRPAGPAGGPAGRGGRRDPAARGALLRPPARRHRARRTAAAGPGEAGRAALHQRYVGPPAAAMLTHRALLANIEQVAAVDPPMIHGDDVVLGVLPLFHVYGLNAVLGVRDAAPRQAGAHRAVRAAGHPRPDRGRGVQRGAGGAAGLRLLARRGAARASGSARCG